MPGPLPLTAKLVRSGDALYRVFAPTAPPFPRPGQVTLALARGEWPASRPAAAATSGRGKRGAHGARLLSPRRAAARASAHAHTDDDKESEAPAPDDEPDRARRQFPRGGGAGARRGGRVGGRGGKTHTAGMVAAAAATANVEPPPPPPTAAPLHVPAPFRPAAPAGLAYPTYVPYVAQTPPAPTWAQRCYTFVAVHLDHTDISPFVPAPRPPAALAH